MTIDGKKLLADYIFTSKYSRWLPELKRRESWDECINRVRDMHLRKFSWLNEDYRKKIEWAFEMVRQKKVLPSMRAMQFAGPAVEKNNSRQFNCCVRHIDSIRAFAEIAFLMICGSGTGIGLGKKYLSRLPDLVDSNDKTGTVVTYTVEDSIEGWADSVEALLMCYFKNTAYSGRKIVFDYCVHPDTKVLKSDLTWEYAKNIQHDDKLIAFDEFNSTNKGKNNRRYLKEAKVIKNKRIKRPSYKITTDRGEVISSQEHRWLVKCDYSHNKQYNNKKYESYEWVETDKLTIGQEIAFATEPWEQDNSFDGGYFSGLLDGEGWVSSTTCGLSQNEGIVSNEIERILDSHNIKYSVDKSPRKNKILTSWRSKNKWEAMKILGIFKPKRLSDKSDYLWKYNAHATGKGHIPAKILKIEFIGEVELIALETDASTFIANGFLSHNSKIRKKGSQLKTSGGTAPGYKPLKVCHNKIKKLLDNVIEELGQHRLKSINIYDILMHIGDVCLAGGIRRTASCVIFDLDDMDMMNAKTYFKVSKYRSSYDPDTNTQHCRVWVGKKWYDVDFRLDDTYEKYDYEINLLNKSTISWFYIEPQRGRSNNSVRLIRGQFTKEQLQANIELSRTCGGEPGFYLTNCYDSLPNPCQPAWAPILTPDGIRTIGDVKIGHKIWSKEGWTTVLNKWSTGINKVYEYRTTSGCFYGTEKHRVVSNGVKIEVENAESIDIISGPSDSNFQLIDDIIMDGIVFGDGSVHEASNNLVYLTIGDNDHDYFSSEISHLITKERPGLHSRAYEIKTSINHSELPLTYLRSVPDRFKFGNRSTVCSFLRGLYTANGSVCDNRITLKASSFQVINDVQLMLSSIGIRSYYTTNKPSKVTFSNGEYLCKQSYDLNISVDRDKFVNSIGFIQKYKNEKIKVIPTYSRKNSYEIIEKTFIREEETFDISVDNPSHTYWTQGCDVSNCFEINFIPVTDDGQCGVQSCNLTTINGAKIKTFEDFLEAVEAETIIGTLQATYTDFIYLSTTAQKLTEEEALLGCSITGIMESPDILLNETYLENAALYAVQINEEWAKILGINPAARVTCLKPEGTGSLVLEVMAPGCHAAHAHTMFRRVQSTNYEPIYTHFKSINPHMCDKSVWNKSGTDDVITFPIEIDKKSIVKADLDAIKHLEIVKKLQQYWVIPGGKNNTKDIHNNVSCTIIVKNDEWEQVLDFIYDNQQYLTAISFLSDAGDKSYQQAPLERVVSDEDWDKFLSLKENLHYVDYTQLNEQKDDTHLIAEASCAGGACLI